MTDLYKKLEQYRDSDFYPFHMPGHKRNKEAVSGALQGAYGVDITEIDGFDNLHEPQGILKRQQQKAADLYNSEFTCFMVNGSTGGILSAIAACTGKGDRLLMARNCHRSVYHAVYLQELKTSFLYPPVIMPYEIADAILPEDVEAALKGEQDIKAVIVTSPTYEGIVSDIRQIAHIAHRYGKPLIVDEAHGAHFGFHADCPESAVKLGADVVIHSLHKTLPAMTQTALIHVCGSRVNKAKLTRYLRIFQSSSPSYVLLASIDSCMDFMAREGCKRLDMLINSRRRFLKGIEKCTHIKAIDVHAMKLDVYGQQMIRMDPCKLVLYVADGLLTGQELYDILRNRYHLQMEMAAGSYVVAIISLMDTEEGFKRLAEALSEIDGELIRKNQDQSIKEIGRSRCDMDKYVSADMEGVHHLLPETVMNIAQAYEEESEEIILDEAEGRTAAEFISLYPPGIPIIVPGEKFTKYIINKIKHYKKVVLNVNGVTNNFINVIK